MTDLLLRAKIWKDALWEDLQGQDLVEYALMSGFVASAAGALMPDVAAGISLIFLKVTILLFLSGGGEIPGSPVGPVPQTI